MFYDVLKRIRNQVARVNCFYEGRRDERGEVVQMETEDGRVPQCRREDWHGTLLSALLGWVNGCHWMWQDECDLLLWYGDNERARKVCITSRVGRTSPVVQAKLNRLLAGSSRTRGVRPGARLPLLAWKLRRANCMRTLVASVVPRSCSRGPEAQAQDQVAGPRSDWGRLVVCSRVATLWQAHQECSTQRGGGEVETAQAPTSRTEHTRSRFTR
jgi:hypothetical protein